MPVLDDPQFFNRRPRISFYFKHHQRSAAKHAWATLDHIKGGTTELPTVGAITTPTKQSRRRVRIHPRFIGHGAILALVLTVIATRGFPQLAFGMDWTQGATVATDHVDHDDHVEELAGIAVPVVIAHTEQDHEDEPVSQMQDSLVPSLLPRQVAVASAFVATHVVGAGEKLGQIAERYSVSVMTIVAANDVDTKMLAIGQSLRIPRVSGLPHVVAEGETVESIAEQYNVPSSTIRFFASNNLGTGRAVIAGEEIFIPGAVAIGNGPTEAEASEATAVPVGTVLDDETRIRTGPSTEFDKIAKLGGDTQIALLGRHENWFNVRTPNGTEGWIAADLLGVSDGVADQVPQVIEVPSLPLVQVQPAEPQPEPAAQPKVEPQPEPKPAPKAQPQPDTGGRWVWPAAGDLTSGFGYRNFRVGRFHNGIDIANRKGTAIRAARAGRVIAAGWCSGYGYCVKINHGDGLVTEYGHLASQPNVRVGEQVVAGERIGSMGNTFDRRGGGYSTGVHLHFTVKRHGKAVNPMRYLP